MNLYKRDYIRAFLPNRRCNCMRVFCVLKEKLSETEDLGR